VGYCKINSVCIKGGTKHPQGCATCDASKSATQWTPNTVNDCLINHQCAYICGGTCVDLQTNINHCSKCNNKCSAPLVCAGGKCTNYVPGSKTFNYIGSQQTFIVPGYAANSVKIEVWGAQGGQGTSNGSSCDIGGKGGYAYGTLKVTPGETLYVYVGGKGNAGNSGGYNGGGAACTYTNTCARGGGATDVRRGGTTLTHRIIVAGGGGGAEWSGCKGTGGAGGGLIGGKGSSNYAAKNGSGGTQSAGGTKGVGTVQGKDGTLGVGGASGSHPGNGHCGSGGGGYYGGGGSAEDGHGGGGSSYYGGMTSNTGTTSGIWKGNGTAKISW